VDISILFGDGREITGAMTEAPPSWIYTIVFYDPPNIYHGSANVTYTPRDVDGNKITDWDLHFPLYVDPAGYIYDTVTGLRINGAVVTLQWPDGFGGWIAVPAGATPPNMLPDVNPLITLTDGQYQWDTVPGTYRVHVEAPGYFTNDSIMVTVPPPVFDLHVGLTPFQASISLETRVNGDDADLPTGPVVADGSTVTFDQYRQHPSHHHRGYR
jgi:hypothetical protein